MGSLFRNSEGLDIPTATGFMTATQQKQASALTEGFSTTLYQKYNAVRALNQAGDAQADSWDLTKNRMTSEQITDSMRQKNEFKNSQTVEAKNRTLLFVTGAVIVGVIAYMNATTVRPSASSQVQFGA